MRILKTRNCIIILLILLIIRLFYISVIDGKKLSKAALSQNTEDVVKNQSRGIIYDRNMIKITNADKEIVKVPGFEPIYISKRYNDGLLSHVVGYMSESGGFGIEKAFDDILKSKRYDTVSVTRDARNNVVTKFGYTKQSSEIYSGIKLSIDYHIQKIAESAMDNHKINGAVIIVDVESGDVLAMASRPNFKQDEIAKYLGSTNGELMDRCVCPYNAGSVFKVVVAAAALQNGFSDEMSFYCPGKVYIDNKEFVCSKKEGHGHISFDEAMAFSCNCAFYEMGQKIGIKAIADTAKAFGFGEEVLNINKLYESRGFIPSDENMGKCELANISIGQGDVMVTPLQIADMLCTVANDGVRKQLTLIKGIVDKDGNCNDLKPVVLGRVISPDTSRILKDSLICGVKFGTGTGANIKDWGAGGKTGSAQTGWFKGGELMTHGWFAGFFPEENPKYVCVVLAENGKTGSASAVPVFREIGENIKHR